MFNLPHQTRLTQPCHRLPVVIHVFRWAERCIDYVSGQLIERCVRAPMRHLIFTFSVDLLEARTFTLAQACRAKRVFDELVNVRRHHPLHWVPHKYEFGVALQDFNDSFVLKKCFKQYIIINEKYIQMTLNVNIKIIVILLFQELYLLFNPKKKCLQVWYKYHIARIAVLFWVHVKWNF